MKHIAARFTLSLLVSLGALIQFSSIGCSEPGIVSAGNNPKTQLALSWTIFSGATSYLSGKEEIAKAPIGEKGAWTTQGEIKPESRDGNMLVAQDQLSQGQATLAWDHVPEAISYNIYWSESPGVNKHNGNKITNATNPYTFRGLTRGKTYYLVVTAVHNSGESEESEELSFTPKK